MSKNEKAIDLIKRLIDLRETIRQADYHIVVYFPVSEFKLWIFTSEAEVNFKIKQIYESRRK